MTSNHKGAAYDRRRSDHRTSPGPSHNTRRNRSNGGKFHTPSSTYGHGVRFRPELESPTTTPSRLEISRLHSRLSFHLKSRSELDEDSESDVSSNSSDDLLLEGIIGSSWKIHQASPLHNFHQHPTRLKQYGKQMREHLSCLPIHSRKNVQFTAKFEWFGPSSDESHFQGLKVEVKSICDGKPPRVSYLGYLLSSEPSTNHPRTGTVHLPLILCFAASKVMLQSVHDNLKKLFECLIRQLEVPQSELMWLSAMLNGQNLAINTANVKDIVQFKFVPYPGKDSLALCLPVKAVRRLWEKIHDHRVPQVWHTEVKAFHDSIQEHFLATLLIDLNSCQFVMFSLPGINMAANGAVKLLSKDIALQTLTFLHSVPTRLESPMPSLGHQDNL